MARYKIVTVRMYDSLFNSLVDECRANRISLNELCLQKLKVKIDVKQKNYRPRGRKAKKMSEVPDEICEPPSDD